MILIGLAGKAGAGKDTVALYLKDRYGFVVFSFSDALYQEVAEAYNLGEDEFLLHDRATKDKLMGRFSLEECADQEFVKVVHTILDRVGGITLPHDLKPLSPRQILQWWGTEYRRAQNPDYWVKRAEDSIGRLWGACSYPEHRPQYLVNTSVRFPNERMWIHSFNGSGNVWHIHRDNLPTVSAHESEIPLAVEGYERELWNNDTIDRLHRGVDLLLRTGAKFVRVEPMAPDEALKED